MYLLKEKKTINSLCGAKHLAQSDFDSGRVWDRNVILKYIYKNKSRVSQDFEAYRLKPPLLTSSKVSEEQLIRREKTRFEQKKDYYLKEYEGKFIAISNDKVLDTDDSFSNLAARVYEKYGYGAIFMTKVTREAKKHRMSPKFNH